MGCWTSPRGQMTASPIGMCPRLRQPSSPRRAAFSVPLRCSLWTDTHTKPSWPSPVPLPPGIPMMKSGQLSRFTAQRTADLYRRTPRMQLGMPPRHCRHPCLMPPDQDCPCGTCTRGAWAVFGVMPSCRPPSHVVREGARPFQGLCTVQRDASAGERPFTCARTYYVMVSSNSHRASKTGTMICVLNTRHPGLPESNKIPQGLILVSGGRSISIKTRTCHWTTRPPEAAS